MFSVQPRALVVDDDEAVLAILRDGLEAAGVDVLTASDGASAIRVLVDNLLTLDLLVTDLSMPGLDGPTLVRIIRAEGGERELPILVLSATISPRDRELLRRLGVSDVLDKREGSERAVARAVELARAGRDRRLAGEKAEEPEPHEVVPLAPLRLVKAPAPLSK